MERKENLLLIIDMQYDFCNAGGALYVPNAESDVENLKSFMLKYLKNIDHIVLTLDNHQVLDISHPKFWINYKGENPTPFGNISYKEVKDKIWTPIMNEELVRDYLRKLEKQGEFPHTIWPEHCIGGSKGAAIVDEVMDTVVEWSRQGRFYDLTLKGTHPLTEHFGALRANIPVEDAPETNFNQNLTKKFTAYKNIVIAGEAKSHCVANTIKQIYEIGPIENNLIILEDCTSDVPGFEEFSQPIYDKAFKNGAKSIKSTDLVLE